MSFQVNSNIAALHVYNILGTHQVSAANALAKVSSGLKAAGGGDVSSQGAAAGLLNAAQTTQNSITAAQNAVNALQAGDTFYAQQILLGQKGVEIGGRAADAGADTSAITAQLTALTNGITDINTKTQFNGADITTARTVALGGGSATVTITATTEPASAVIADFLTFVSNAVDLRATNASNLAAMQNALAVLNSVSANELAGVGMAQDQDLAKGMMNLTSANIMTEAATAMLAQAMQLPNAVLKLLQ